MKASENSVKVTVKINIYINILKINLLFIANERQTDLD